MMSSMDTATTLSSSSPPGQVRRRVGNFPPNDLGIPTGGSTSQQVPPPESGSKFHHLYASQNNTYKKRMKGYNNNQTGFTFAMIPLWAVALLCGLFLFLGYMQQNYFHERVIIDTLSKHSQNNIIKKSLLTKEDDTALEYDPNNDNLRYHVIFSTDCSPYQHWQSYLVYYSAMKMKQYGHVTRIVSGCNATEEISMKEWFENEIAYMSSRFHIILTPSFSTLRNEKGDIIGDYKFFNKPFGLLYYLEHFPLLQYDSSLAMSFPKDIVKNDVIILIDPDMGFMKPITADYTNPKNVIVSELRQYHYPNSTKYALRMGQPLAQTYGFGTQWARLNLTKITNDPNTPALSVTTLDGRLYYPVGPPYIVMVADMYQIATYWSKFVKPTYDQYPHLLAEMFAYCIAAAHTKLPHIVLDSLMISDIDMDSGEGWSFIDDNANIPYNETCTVASNIINNNNKTLPIPNVFHMCQRYAIGDEWFFSKRKIPSNIYDCDRPLFRMPTDDIIQYTYKHPPGGKKQEISTKDAKRYTFSICYLYSLLNDAIHFHKMNSCSNPNLSYTRNLVAYATGKEDNEKKAAVQ